MKQEPEVKRRIKTKFLWLRKTLPIYTIQKLNYDDMKLETQWLKIADVYQEWDKTRWIDVAFINYEKLKQELDII